MNKLTKQNASFTQVPNELLQDKSLSMKAKGLYAIMFSKPQDWTFYESAFVSESADVKDALNSALKELLDAGWLTRTGRRAEGGKFAAYDYEILIADNHSGKPAADKPLLENRDGKPATTNTNLTNTETVIPPTPKGEPDGFEEIWKARWGRGKASQPRQPAQRAFSAALKKGAKAADILAGVKARVSVDKPDTEYAPMLATWLNQGRWKDGSGAAVLSADDLEAARKRQEAAAEAHKARMQALVEERSNALLKRA